MPTWGIDVHLSVLLSLLSKNLIGHGQQIALFRAVISRNIIIDLLMFKIITVDLLVAQNVTYMSIIGMSLCVVYQNMYLPCCQFDPVHGDFYLLCVLSDFNSYTC